MQKYYEYSIPPNIPESFFAKKLHFCVIFDVYQAKLPFLDLFLALIIEKEANGRLEEELYKGGR